MKPIFGTTAAEEKARLARVDKVNDLYMAIFSIIIVCIL
jgi:hypothetical protein